MSDWRVVDRHRFAFNNLHLPFHPLPQTPPSTPHPHLRGHRVSLATNNNNIIIIIIYYSTAHHRSTHRRPHRTRKSLGFDHCLDASLHCSSLAQSCHPFNPRPPSIMASSSSYNLRPRLPLCQLPLSRFVPGHNAFPSPVSIPLKRNAPSSSSTSTLDSPGKMRKVSYTDNEGEETIRRTRVKQITPQAKSILERDDLGVGRSPARRLFVTDVEGRR